MSLEKSNLPIKVCDGRDVFGFVIVNFLFFVGKVPQRPSCGISVSWLVRFARTSLFVGGFGGCNRFLTTRLLGQGCWCCRLRKVVFRFYHGHCELVGGVMLVWRGFFN